MRPRHLHRLGGGAGRAGRARPVRPRPAPALRRRRHLPLPRRRAAGPRPAGSSPSSTPGSTPGRCRRPSSTTRSPATASSRRRFPADFICEAIDQTRGWFYSLLAVNTLVFGQTPYRNVVCLAHVVDQDGAEDVEVEGQRHRPLGDLPHQGRRRRCAGTSSPPARPWTNRRVYDEGIDESIRKFLLTLWNTLSFFVTYANLDGLRPPAPGRPPPRGPRRSTAGSRSRLHGDRGRRSPRRSRATTPWPRPARSRPSSTTSPTGTCAGPGPGSGRRRRRRLRHPHDCLSRWPGCWPPSPRSWPTRSTAILGRAAGGGRASLGAPGGLAGRRPARGRPRPRGGDGPGPAPRGPGPGRPGRRQDRRSASPCAGRCPAAPERDGSPPRWPPRWPRSSTSRPSRWSRAWTA